MGVSFARVSKLASVVVVVLLALPALTAQQKGPLTNADVIKMVKAGMAEPTIVAAIAANDTQFDLSSSGLQSLSQAGVSSKVIRAMLAAESKKKDAAAAAENAAAASNVNTTQDSAPDTSAGMNPQGMSPQGMPQGMSSEQMQQMMANMPPEMRERMQASMAQRNATGRSGRGGASANSIPPHAGVPVPLDSPLYTSFTRLKTQPGYRMIMSMHASDPKMEQMAQSIFSPGELVVQGNTRQYTMHYKMQATDVPGTVDDWEIRSVVQNGRGASLITSAAVPRLLKLSAENAARQLADLDRMAATSMARAAAEGPMGAIGAGMTAASVAMAHVEVPRMLKKEREMFSWRCRDVPRSDESGSHPNTNLTDLHSIGEQNVSGTMADGYEFYDYENAKTQGTIRLFVAKDTGLPLRIEMADSSGVGGIQMNYVPLTDPANIEIPACMNAH
ncbi:MAG: hypothetical protein WA637_15685 [Terriglobales bacterium]